MKKAKQKPFYKRRVFVIAALVAVLLIGVAAWLLVSRPSHGSAENPPLSSPQPTNATYNLNPATDEEKKETDQHKDELAQQAQTPPPAPSPAGQKKQGAVVITSADAANVSAYVSGVLEDGGVCTATFVKDGQTVTRTSQGFSNVSTTNCAPITPNLPGSGSWSLTLSYSSAMTEGQTQTTVKVP